MRKLFLILVVLLIIQAVTATSLVTTSGSAITEALIQVREGAESRDYLISASQPLVLPATTEGMMVLVKAGDGETFDYGVELHAGIVPERVVIHPIGLVFGEVRDSADNLLVHAPITIDCPTASEQLETDGTGGFRIFLPAELCRFSVSHDGRGGSKDTEILQGKVNKAQLIVESQGVARGWIIIIVALVIAVILWFVIGKKDVVIDAKKSKKAPKSRYVAEDVKKALKEKEVLIVDELLLRGGSAKLSELRTAAKIPRTSMLRCLEGLEQRGLILKKTENGKVFVELVKKN